VSGIGSQIVDFIHLLLLGLQLIKVNYITDMSPVTQWPFQLTQIW